VGDHSLTPKRRTYTRRAHRQHVVVPKNREGDPGARPYSISKLLRMDLRFSRAMATAGYARQEQK